MKLEVLVNALASAANEGPQYLAINRVIIIASYIHFSCLIVNVLLRYYDYHEYQYQYIYMTLIDIHDNHSI